MYQVNDYIVYGNVSVCKVIDICTPKINGIKEDMKYYMLQPIYQQGSTIYTPVNNDKVVMRKIISKEEAEQLIDTIPSIEIIKNVINDRLLVEEYNKAIRTNDDKEWIKVIKTLYIKSMERKNQGKKPEKIVEDYLKFTEDLLHGELAISLGMTKEQVESYIIERIEKLAD